MHKTAFILLMLAFAPGLAVAASDDELRQQIVGSWGENAECASGSLMFNADGTFMMTRADTGEQMNGQYQIVGGVLSGSSAEGAMPEVAIRIEEAKLTLENGGQVVNELIRCTVQ
jgi:hypothetical protein